MKMKETGKQIRNKFVAAIVALLVALPILGASAACAAAGVNVQARPAQPEKIDYKHAPGEDGVEFDPVRAKAVMLEDGYSDAEANNLIRYFVINDQGISAIINAYVADRTILDKINVHGVTLKGLMEKRKYKFWDALNYLNFTMDYPKMATLLRLPLVAEEFSGDEQKIEVSSAERSVSGKKNVLKFDKALVKRIMLEERLDPGDADRTIESLSRVDGRLQKVLDDYLASRTITDDFNVAGMTIPLTMAVFKQDGAFWNALLYMNGYMQDPIKAWECRSYLDKHPGSLIYSHFLR